MNKEDYVSLEVAKLLKEKGYDEDCNTFIVEECWGFNKGKLMCVDKDRELCTFPTLYEAQKWLWKEKQLLVTSFLDESFAEPYQFLWSIQDAKKEIDNYGNVISKCKYNSYEEALNAGILEALKTI